MRFWKLRQSEYESYKLQCSPLVIRQVRRARNPRLRPPLIISLSSGRRALPATLGCAPPDITFVIRQGRRAHITRLHPP